MNPRSIPITALTSHAFSPFGTLLTEPASPAAASGPGWRWWAAIASLGTAHKSYDLGFLSLAPYELSFDWAERHQRSQELIVPMGGQCLVYVAPPGEGVPQPNDFRVFEVGRGQAVLLDRGVWHGAPLAVDVSLSALVVLVEGTGQNDTRVERFETISVDRPKDQ